MSAARRSFSFRPSPTRIVLWGIASVIIAILAFTTNPGILGDRLDAARRKAEANADVPRTSFDASSTTPARGTTAVRIGTLDRAAHLATLSGAEMNLYQVAAKEHGRATISIFRESSELEDAFRDGKLDAATVTLRSAVNLILTMGDSPPSIVAGAALGDEVLLVPNDESDQPVDLAGKRVAVIEAPGFDLKRTLGQASVLLTSRASLRKKLAAREFDYAVVAEPLASSVAALAGARTRDLASVDDPPSFQAGAVFILSHDLLHDHADLAASLVQAQELSSFIASKDPQSSVERALDLLARKRIPTPSDIFWHQGLSHVELSTDIPDDALRRLFALAAEIGLVESPPPLEQFVRRDLLEEARRIQTETDDH